MAEARRVELAMPVDDAYQRVYAAMASIGKVEDANPVTRTIVGKARYGLNPVRLRIAVLTSTSGTGSVLEIGGKGQDVWGASSRKVTDRLVSAIR